MKNPRKVAYMFAAGAIIFVFIGIFSRRQPWPPDQSQKPTQNPETEVQESSTGEVGIPNPASVFCEEQGGMLEIIEDLDNEQVGICFFDEYQSFCEEWEFYRGECKKGQYKLEDLVEEATPTGESVIDESYLEAPTCESCGR